MPEQTQEAVNWALQQTFDYGWGAVPVTRYTPAELVEAVRNYFNAHSIQYNTFSFDDLLPFLN